MKNTPSKIYLQIGGKCPDDVDFKELNNVTWSVNKVNDNDIVYYRKAQKMTCKHTEGCVIREINDKYNENKKYCEL